jgi:serine/threonine-protein kinase
MSGIIELEAKWARGPQSRVGQELNGKWTLLRVLGVGGASTVYEAVHRNGRRAAVKIMSQQKIREIPTCRIAAHEGLLANAVAHPGVVEILDDDVAEDGSAYLVMELLDGETLDKKRRRAGGRLPFDEALPLFEQLLDVLTAAHDRGIVHRDIKPDNVFVTREGRIKVLDFGLAVAASEEREDAPWFGTPGYMPPEQARADWPEVDALSDVWAAAATFYTVLTGRLVHDRRTPAALVRAAASEEVDLSALEEVAPLRFVDVLARALATDKTDRWPSARALSSAVRVAAKAERKAFKPGPLRTIPPIPRCRSTTRVFLLKAVESGKAACGGCDTRECGLTCIMCPVCPEGVTVRQAV